jgi:hypothetical protein
MLKFVLDGIIESRWYNFPFGEGGLHTLVYCIPPIMYCVCGASQLFVFTIGLTHLSQLHPGSSVILPIAVPFLNVVSSSLPFSNVRVSSGEFIDFFSIGAPPVGVAILI